MSNILFRTGKQNLGSKAINLASGGDTLKATALNMNTAGGKIAIIASSTNATPIVVTTSGTHGYTAGDVVVVGGHTTNTAANGTWTVGTTTTNTFQLLTLLDSVNSTGNGVGGATGWCIDITTAATLADVSANTNGTDATLGTQTLTGDVFNAASWTYTAMAATQVSATAVYSNTASNDLIAFFDGRIQIYVVTQANSTSTAIAVQRLAAAIATGTTIVFSDGASATLSAQANIGDTSIAVTSTAATIHRQATADVPTLSNGFPMTPGSGGSLVFQPDSGSNKVFRF